MANWEITLEGRQGSNDMLNVFHYVGTGTNPPDWDATAAVFYAHIDEHLVPIAGSRVTWLGITVREDIEGGVGQFVPFPAGTLTGTQATPDQIDVVSMLIRKHCNSLVKPTYGWFQQGGITVQGVGNDNQWGSTVTDAVLAYAEDIRILNVAGGAVLTMHVKARNPSAPNTQAYSPVTSFSHAAAPRTQRSRLQGTGS